jgi:hypothetical protein
LYVTWLLGHWPISANVVTACALIVGWAAAACIATKGYFVVGVAALWFWYLLDHVDGQLARLRGTHSLTGMYFDFMMHHLIHPAVAFALGYGTARCTDDLRWTLAGAGFAFGTMALSLTNDCRYKAFFAATSPNRPLTQVPSAAEGCTVRNRLRLKYQSSTSQPSQHASATQISSRSPMRTLRLFHATHAMFLRACEIPNIMLALSAVAAGYLSDSHFGSVAEQMYLLSMSLLAPLLALLRLIKQVWNQLPDRDFHATFVPHDA